MKSFLLLFSLLTFHGFSQSPEKVIVAKQDSFFLYVNDGESTELFYYKMVPKKLIKGALVILPGMGESVESVMEQISWDEAAVKEGYLVLFPSFNFGQHFSEPTFQFLDTIFQQVMDEYDISSNEFVIGGLSLGGSTALSYAETSVKDSSTLVVPKAVFGLDPPVDEARLYNYCLREIDRNFSEGGVGEAKFLIDWFNRKYGGSPTEVPESYVETSIYSYGAENGGNAQYLKDIPVQLYSDLNVDWLLNERHRDLYDWNGSDLVAMVNDLKMMGNDQANVTISHCKGIRPNGKVHPHSWSIVDEKSFMQWLLQLENN